MIGAIVAGIVGILGVLWRPVGFVLGLLWGFIYGMRKK